MTHKRKRNARWAVVACIITIVGSLFVIVVGTRGPTSTNLVETLETQHRIQYGLDGRDYTLTYLPPAGLHFVERLHPLTWAAGILILLSMSSIFVFMNYGGTGKLQLGPGSGLILILVCGSVIPVGLETDVDATGRVVMQATYAFGLYVSTRTSTTEQIDSISVETHQGEYFEKYMYLVLRTESGSQRLTPKISDHKLNPGRSLQQELAQLCSWIADKTQSKCLTETAD